MTLILCLQTGIIRMKNEFSGFIFVQDVLLRYDPSFTPTSPPESPLLLLGKSGTPFIQTRPSVQNVKGHLSFAAEANYLSNQKKVNKEILTHREAGDTRPPLMSVAVVTCMNSRNSCLRALHRVHDELTFAST